MPTLFAVGVDAIQGSFFGMYYRNLMCPNLQRVDSSSGPAWHGPEQSGRGVPCSWKFFYS